MQPKLPLELCQPKTLPFRSSLSSRLLAADSAIHLAHREIEPLGDKDRLFTLTVSRIGKVLIPRGHL